MPAAHPVTLAEENTGGLPVEDPELGLVIGAQHGLNSAGMLSCSPGGGELSMQSDVPSVRMSRTTTPGSVAFSTDVRALPHEPVHT